MAELAPTIANAAIATKVNREPLKLKREVIIRSGAGFIVRSIKSADAVHLPIRVRIRRDAVAAKSLSESGRNRQRHRSPVSYFCVSYLRAFLFPIRTVEDYHPQCSLPSGILEITAHNQRTIAVFLESDLNNSSGYRGESANLKKSHQSRKPAIPPVNLGLGRRMG